MQDVIDSEAIMKRPNYLRSSFVFLPKNQRQAMEVVHFYTHLFFAHSKWYHEWEDISTCFGHLNNRSDTFY